MVAAVTCLVVVSSAWIALDAEQIGYSKRDVQGLAAIGPFGWFVSGLLLWVVTFPVYLASRGKLVEAARRRGIPDGNVMSPVLGASAVAVLFVVVSLLTGFATTSLAFSVAQAPTVIMAAAPPARTFANSPLKPPPSFEEEKARLAEAKKKLKIHRPKYETEIEEILGEPSSVIQNVAGQGDIVQWHFRTKEVGLDVIQCMVHRNGTISMLSY